MLLITAKKEPPVAGQRKEPSVVKESQENQQSVIEDSQPSSDAENIQASPENKAIHSSNTDLNEALQDKQSPQTSQETISSENDETPLNPRVVSVGQNEVFCAATGRPCTNPSSEHAHEHNVDSASQTETLNSENVDSETRTSPEDSSIDSDSETSTEATQSRQITNDCSSLVNEQNSRSTEHKNVEEAEDEHPENVDATVRT